MADYEEAMISSVIQLAEKIYLRRVAVPGSVGEEDESEYVKHALASALAFYESISQNEELIRDQVTRLMFGTDEKGH